MTYDEKKSLYETIMHDMARIVKTHINSINEDDLFFDRHQMLMSPFDSQGSAGGLGRRNKFYEELQLANEEREVDFIYDKYMQKFFKTQITHPFKCDGLINTETENAKKLKIIFEYK